MGLTNCVDGYRTERDEGSIFSCVPKTGRGGVRRRIVRCLNLGRPNPESE
jgi:hypothetical protein